MDALTQNLSEKNPVHPIPRQRDATDEVPDGALRQRLDYPARGTAVLTVRGGVDVVTAPQLAEMLQRRLCSTLNRLVLNLSELGFLGVAGVSVIFESDLRARHNGTDLVIVTGGNRQVTRALTVTTERRLLIQHDTGDEFVSS